MRGFTGSSLARLRMPCRWQPPQHGFQQQVLARAGDIPDIAEFVVAVAEVRDPVRVRIAPVPVLAGLGREAHPVERPAVGKQHVHGIRRVSGPEEIVAGGRAGEGFTVPGRPDHGPLLVEAEPAVAVGGKNYDAGKGAAGARGPVQHGPFHGPPPRLGNVGG
jgi:hypothetical protein